MSDVFQSLHTKISKKLLSKRYLEKYNIDKALTENYLKSQLFSETLFNIISLQDFNCHKVLTLCEPMLNILQKGNAPQDWLQYIYQYTLNKSFPDAVTIALNNELNSSCEFFLRVYRIICEFEKDFNYGSFKNKYAIRFLSYQEESSLESADEYKKFIKAFKDSYIYELMRLSEDILNYNTLDHICGYIIFPCR